MILIIFKQKYFSHYILLHDQIDFTSSDIGQYVFGIVYFPGCDVIKFEINLIFLVKLFFSTRPKSHDKNLNILRTRNKHCSSFLKSKSQLPKKFFLFGSMKAL